MRKRWRVRRVAKWAGVVCLVLLIAAFCLSRYWFFALSVGNIHVGAISGNLAMLYAPGFGFEWSFRKVWEISPPRTRLLYFYYKSSPTSRGSRRVVSFPLWIPFVLVALPTAFLWWRDQRRIPPGYCRKCGYDLTGNVSGACPECAERI